MKQSVLSYAVLVYYISSAFHVCNGYPNKSKSAQRACIIGAGYSGLGTARYMKEFGVNFTVFEASKYVGGTWRFDPRVGLDEDGIPMFTSMYKNLRVNTPRLMMEYRGFPFPEGTQSFPTGECFYKYVKLFTKHFDLYKHIQFKSMVTSVKWEGDHWNVKYMKTDTKTYHTEQCGFIVVASGEYTNPIWPKFDNQESFQGKIIHSHDYRDAEMFRNRSVLIIGAGPSGLDLAFQLASITTKLVHSHHSTFNQNLSKTYVAKPDVKKFTSTGVVFKDDTFEEIEDVVFCTGYGVSYPFLDERSGILTAGKAILPVHNYMVNIVHPSMVFVGTAGLSFSTAREAQGEYAAALAAEKFKLPSREKMLEDWVVYLQSLLAKNKTLDAVNHISDMDKYLESLSQESGIYRRAPVLTTIKNFNAKIRMEDLLNYRDYDLEIIDDNNYKRWYNPRKGNPCPYDV